MVALEKFRGGKVNAKRICIGVVKNPLIIGALVAFLFVLTGIKMPMVLEKTVRDVSKIATPLALIILGGSFAFSTLCFNWKSLLIIVIGKLVLVPVCFLSLGVAVGFRGVELSALLALFASPTAVSSFSMAQQMEADDELAGQIVVMTSLCSIVTIFCWISGLSHFGFLG